MSENARVEMQRAQLVVLLVALDELRRIYPKSVQEYCEAMLAIAKAVGLPIPVLDALAEAQPFPPAGGVS